MPYVAEAKNTRRLPAVPVVDRVPLMVCWESKVTVVTPAEDGAVTDRLLKVFAPLMLLVTVVVPVNATLLNVTPPAKIPSVDAVPVKLIWLVPALKVRADPVTCNALVLIPEILIVEALKLTTLVCTPEVPNLKQVTA